MTKTLLRIGTRASQLAVWQANHVRELLKSRGIDSELVPIKSDGDLNHITPLYEFGVRGIFVKALDTALLNNKIDIAVHSMKDVPVQGATGIVQPAVLKRASYKDILVFKGDQSLVEKELGIDNGIWKENLHEHTNDSAHSVHNSVLTIATSSIRRTAQWLNRYPHHHIEDLRGNVNTRLRKLQENNWNGIIFAAAGLERIGLRPKNAINLDWMLPAPAQGAITISCREKDTFSLDACLPLNDEATFICTQIERDFLRTLLGGCATPISALANIENEHLTFKGNILSVDGGKRFDIQKKIPVKNCGNCGVLAAKELLEYDEVKKIVLGIQHENR